MAKITQNFQCEKQVRDTFQKLYPSMLTRFLENCVKRANKDKDFVFDILFNEVK